MEGLWLTTVRSDGIRRARVIDKRANEIPCHLLFDKANEAAAWMEKQVAKFWPWNSRNIGKQNGMTTVYIRGGESEERSLLFGTVQQVRKYGKH